MKINEKKLSQRELTMLFLFSLNIFLIIGVILSIKVTMTNPLQDMISAMKKLAKGDFHTRIRFKKRGYRPKEIREFADSFNRTAEELDSVEVLKKDFINTFSHEFKTPITSIGGFARLMRDSNLDEEIENKYLDIIIEESDRMSRLASRVLDLSKIESQSLLTGRTTFIISESIRRSILELEPKWSAADIHVELGLDDASYYGNAELLKHVWLNILDNTVKFSPYHSTLHVSVRDTLQQFVFSVRDEGPGMDEHVKEHIFEKFFQGDTSHTTPGNGLGMTMAQKIVSLHNGTIQIDSAPAKGTTVTVILPKR